MLLAGGGLVGGGSVVIAGVGFSMGVAAGGALAGVGISATMGTIRLAIASLRPSWPPLHACRCCSNRVPSGNRCQFALAARANHGF